MKEIAKSIITLIIVLGLTVHGYVQAITIEHGGENTDKSAEVFAAEVKSDLLETERVQNDKQTIEILYSETDTESTASNTMDNDNVQTKVEDIEDDKRVTEKIESVNGEKSETESVMEVDNSHKNTESAEETEQFLEKREFETNMEEVEAYSTANSEFRELISSSKLLDIEKVLTFNDRLFFCSSDKVYEYYLEENDWGGTFDRPNGELVSDQFGMYLLCDDGVYQVNPYSFTMEKLNTISYVAPACIYQDKIYVFKDTDIYIYYIKQNTWESIVNRVALPNEYKVRKCEKGVDCIYVYASSNKTQNGKYYYNIYKFNISMYRFDDTGYEVEYGGTGVIGSGLLCRIGGQDEEEKEFTDWEYDEEHGWMDNSWTEYFYTPRNGFDVIDIENDDYFWNKSPKLPCATNNAVGIIIGKTLYVVIERTLYSYYLGEFVETPFDNKFSSVAIGEKHVLQISDGKVYAMGDNSRGQLGIAGIAKAEDFTEVEGLNNIISVDAGIVYSIALAEDGTVYTWGDKLYESGYTSVPHTIPNLPSMKKISAGAENVLMLDIDGNVWSFGANKNYETGSASGVPSQVTFDLEFIDIASGGAHSIALEADNEIWGCGKNDKGQTGVGGGEVIYTFQQADIFEIEAIQAGNNHTLALKKDGRVCAWGDNSHGQVGVNCANEIGWNPEIIGPILAQSIYARGDSNVVYDTEGKIYSFGRNDYGQLGRKTDSVYTNIPEVASNLQGINDMSMNTYTAFAVDESGTLVNWGRMANSENIQPYTLRRVKTPFKVKTIDAYRSQALAIDDGGQVLAWGEGYFADGTDAMKVQNYPVTIKGISNPVQVSRGKNHNLVLDKNGDVWGWGSNSGNPMNHKAGKLRVAMKIEGITDVKQVAAGTEFSIFLKKDGTLWGVGKNSSGQLGQGNTTNVPAITQITDKNDFIKVSVGENYAAALAEDGLYLWGGNAKGQLGNGTKTNNPVPAKAEFALEADEKIIDVSAGIDFCMALTNKGNVYTWGDNGSGELGQGDKLAVYTPVLVKGLSDIVSISAGKSSAVALASNGKIYGWGYASNGILAVSSGSISLPRELSAFQNANTAAINLGYDFAVGVTYDGKLYTCGNNMSGQTGYYSITPNLFDSPAIRDMKWVNENMSVFSEPITANISLRTDAPSGSSVTWVSENPEYIANDGLLIDRPHSNEQDVIVTLQVTVCNPADGFTFTKCFDITVVALPEEGGQQLIDVQSEHSYLISLKVSQLTSSANQIFVLRYNANDLEVTDAVAQTSDIQVTKGISSDRRIEVVNMIPGEIRLRYLGEIPSGSVLNGVINMTKFRAKRDANTKINAFRDK